ncbi:tachykinin-like peptides receptor 86C [Acanthaster planci]|uniref:Tachykinin-like peptides receptor 86C n=1 Tax=Acanthaster planci TaxID=133434 RepID=A0A8B7Z7L9_ACAPL|nr:tachykinin-like peptides receptor 86C [Acanthaster planci]
MTATGPPPVPDEVPLTLAVKIVYSSIAALGITGNSLAIYVLASMVISRRGNTNILLVNQSLIDLVTSMFLVLCYLVPGQRPPAATPFWRAFVCYVWNSKYLFWAMTVTSIFNLLLLTFERYFATLHPIRYHNSRCLAWPKSLLLAMLPWVLGYLLPIYKLMGHYLDDRGRCHLRHFQSLPVKITYSVLILVLDYILPLTLMVIAYVRICRALWATTITGSPPTEQTPILPKGELRNHPARRNVIKTLVTVCGVFSLLWLPNQLAYFYYNIEDVHLNEDFFAFSISFAFLNMCVNPFIYTFQYHQFREGLGRAIPCLARFKILRIPQTNTVTP